MTVRRATVAGVLGIALAIGACSSGSDEPLPEPSSEGGQLYTQHCARCHGANATGLTGPDLRTGYTTDEVRTAVTNGVGGRMPAFEDDLTPAQIDTIATYIAGIARDESS